MIKTTVRLGIFIFLAILMFVGGIFLIGRKDFLFSPTYRLFAVFDNVARLNNGAEVRVAGVHAGTVDSIKMPPHPGEKVIVVMRLQNSSRQLVRKDSEASVLTEGLLGNKYVSISTGSKNAAAVQDEDTIQGLLPVDISDIIQKSSELLDTTKNTVNNLEQITAKIERGEGTVGGLVHDRKVYEKLNQTVQQAQKGVVSFQENMEALKGNFFLRGFFKDRGYTDSSELAKHELQKLPPKEIKKKYVYPSKDLFSKPDTAKLQNDKRLKDAGEFLERNSFRLAVVAAYSDGLGEKDKNEVLTQAQSMIVRKYLIDHYRIDDARVMKIGMGEDGGAARENASRIEIIIY